MKQALIKVCNETGFTLLRLGYNEPGKGKDQADREAALAKGRISSYIACGNDVTTPDELKQAILYKCLDQDLKVAIMKFGQTKSDIKNVTKVTNISRYRSIVIEDKFATFYEFYNLGKGHKIELAEPVLECEIEVVSPFEGNQNIGSK